MLAKIEKIASNANNPLGTIFFVHSFMGTFQLRESMREYYKGYNFYAINLPGHGSSPIEKPSDITLDNSIQLLKTYIEENNLDNIIMVGHSLGGGMAAILNTIFPDKIKLNIFEAPACGVMERNFDVIQKLIPSSIDEAKAILEKMYFNLPKMFGTALNKVIKETYEKTNKKFGAFKKIFTYDKIKKSGEAFDEAFKKINVPSLVVMGKTDGILPTGLLADHFKFMNNPNISQKIVDRASHVIYFEQQKQFLTIMDQFLTEHGFKTR